MKISQLLTKYLSTIKIRVELQKCNEKHGMWIFLLSIYILQIRSLCKPIPTEHPACDILVHVFGFDPIIGNLEQSPLLYIFSPFCSLWFSATPPLDPASKCLEALFSPFVKSLFPTSPIQYSLQSMRISTPPYHLLAHLWWLPPCCGLSGVGVCKMFDTPMESNIHSNFDSKKV